VQLVGPLARPGHPCAAELVESLRGSGSGAPVELPVEGTPVPLPAGVELSAYGDDGVEVEVTSDAGTSGPRPGGGFRVAARLPVREDAP